VRLRVDRDGSGGGGSGGGGKGKRGSLWSGGGKGGGGGKAEAAAAAAWEAAIKQAEAIGGPLMLRVAAGLRAAVATRVEIERRVGGAAGVTVGGGGLRAAAAAGGGGEDEAAPDLRRVFAQGLTFATEASRQVRALRSDRAEPDPSHAFTWAPPLNNPKTADAGG